MTRLDVIMYHYVLNPPKSCFPHLKGITVDAFRNQVRFLQGRYEMATLESALAFVGGGYVPKQNLCLLTFDDGLRDHYENVLPILSELEVQGIFFAVTECLDQQQVSSTHKSHLLLAELGFEEYQRALRRNLAEQNLSINNSVDKVRARHTYRWDSEEVAIFKYFLNFCLDGRQRAQIINKIFKDQLTDEPELAKKLYLSWDEVTEIQSRGMIIGGHSHRHHALAKLTREEQQKDIATCACMLRQRLGKQVVWPFSYPYGKKDTFDKSTVHLLKENGFDCAFSSEPGKVQPKDDVYALRRVDTNSIRIEKEPLKKDA